MIPLIRAWTISLDVMAEFVCDTMLINGLRRHFQSIANNPKVAIIDRETNKSCGRFSMTELGYWNYSMAVRQYLNDQSQLKPEAPIKTHSMSTWYQLIHPCYQEEEFGRFGIAAEQYRPDNFPTYLLSTVRLHPISDRYHLLREMSEATIRLWQCRYYYESIPSSLGPLLKSLSNFTQTFHSVIQRIDSQDIGNRLI